eukprot:6317034-Heterocapsa_arctica.AAC.1
MVTLTGSAGIAEQLSPVGLERLLILGLAWETSNNHSSNWAISFARTTFKWALKQSGAKL